MVREPHSFLYNPPFSASSPPSSSPWSDQKITHLFIAAFEINTIYSSLSPKLLFFLSVNNFHTTVWLSCRRAWWFVHSVPCDVMTKVVEEHAAHPLSAVSLAANGRSCESHTCCRPLLKKCVHWQSRNTSFLHLLCVCVCVCVWTECKCRRMSVWPSKMLLNKQVWKDERVSDRMNVSDNEWINRSPCFVAVFKATAPSC